MMMKFTVTSVMTLMMTLHSAWGHGMMIDPPQRSSMWRYGYPDSPANYNDNGLYCGGFAKQYKVNGGKCGICGDDYSDPVPRENEAGGKYATGVIVQTYQRGDIIDVTVRITANHRGYFIFKLCANNDVKKAATQECLDQNVLKVIGPDGQDMGNKFYIDSKTGDKHIRLQLPAELTCAQCVLQWTYNTGNSWGCDNDNTCGIGRGDQENFVNCADIAIVGSLNGSGKPNKVPVVPTKAPPPPPQRKPTPKDCTCRPAAAFASVGGMTSWCCKSCALGYCPGTHCVCS